MQEFLELPGLMTAARAGNVNLFTSLVHYGIVIATINENCYTRNTVHSTSTDESHCTGNSEDYISTNAVQCSSLSNLCYHCNKILKNIKTEGEQCFKDDSSCDSVDSCPDRSLHHYLSIAVQPSSIAYILHTSGSTGVPKKVSVPHCCITPNIIDLKDKLDMTCDDRVFNAAPLTFDPSIVEIFLTLSCGASLVVVPDSVKSTPTLLAQVLVQQQKVTVLQVTPSLFNQLPESVISDHLLGEFSFLRVLAFGGEICPGLSLLMRWKSKKNLTRIFNLYGITEVSCWATCYEVIIDSSSAAITNDDPPSGVLVPPVDDTIPIGECLLDTSIELRDETLTAEGVEGVLWIGGHNRVCLIDSESELCKCTWRNSGDVALKVNSSQYSRGNMYIVGRMDRQIKRMGHRVNMDYIQQVISSLPMVSSCAVLTSTTTSSTTSGSTARTTSGSTAGTTSGSTARTTTTSVQDSYHPVILVAAIVPATVSTELFDLREFFRALTKLLPSSHIPDRVVCVDCIPTNSHGKCDILTLHQTLKNHWKNVFLKQPTECDHSEISRQLLEVINTVLPENVLHQESISVGAATDSISKHSLIELGASSFDIIRIINLLEDRLCVFDFEGMDWFGPLSTKPIEQVVDCVYDSLYKTKRKRPLTQAHSSDDAIAAPSKVFKLEHNVEKTLRRGIITVKGSVIDQSLVPHCYQEDHSTHLSQCNILWTVPTGKCVDSSPLVVVSCADGQGTCSSVVYVGSHSGLLLAICLDSGRVKWRTLLPDRLESSPCVSACGSFIVIGCYNGCVYIVSSADGSVVWCYETVGVSTGDPVKSSPSVDQSNGQVWFGSHDKHIYCIDIYARQPVYQIYLDGGSCFSSPTVVRSRSLVYIGTLKGNLFSIDTTSGCILWSYSCSKPLFSSPTCLPNGGIAIGCVDGCVHIVSHSGHKIQILETQEAIFSTCVSVVSSLDSSCYLYSGSHDNHMYCWEQPVDDVGNGSGLSSYRLKWKTKLDSSIYSTCMLTSYANLSNDKKPSAHSLNTESATVEHSKEMCYILKSSSPLLCVSSCKGTVYLLDPFIGRVITCEALPGEVYSSPVVVTADNGNCCGLRIVVGCRDESVYCLQFT